MSFEVRVEHFVIANINFTGHLVQLTIERKSDVPPGRARGNVKPMVGLSLPQFQWNVLRLRLLTHPFPELELSQFGT